MAKCRHNFQPAGWNVPPPIRKLRKKNWPNITLQCRKCQERIQRPMTKDEVRVYRKDWVESDKETKAVHKLWWAFSRQFGDKDNIDGFKLSGIEFMDAVEKFAEKHPEVIVTGCDDSSFCSSSIVLIPHKCPTYYMGTTMVIIPQYGRPLRIFLYPNHTDQLVEGLKGVSIGKQPDWERIYKKNTKRLVKNCRRRWQRRKALEKKP